MLYAQASAMGHAQASVWLGELEEKKADPDLPTAYRYYALAAYQHDSDAKIYLEQLATDNAEAQYVLGFHYYQAQGDDSQAAYWCVKAHTQGHQQALEYLRQTSFDGALCLQIARQYEANDASQYLSFAAEFYKKASDLGEAQASFRFAQLHETEHEGIPCDHATAYQYYALAARRLHPEAEMHLKQLASSDNSAAQYALGFYYYREQRNVSQAVFWCVKAHLLGDALALDYLTQSHFSASVYLQMAHHYETDGSPQDISHAIECYKKASQQGNGQASFRLAQRYEAGYENVGPDHSTAYRYYALAARQRHPDAKTYLEQLVSANHSEALYALGVHYYHEQDDVSQAVHWCVKAHLLGHTLAFDYITQTALTAPVYLQIARHYKTEGTVEHLSHAIEFYKKASALGEAQASFSLAQLYETGNEVMDANPSESIHYYVLALEQKHPDARMQLEHLASTGSAQAQYAFGYHVCRKEGDMAQAARWCVKAHLLGHALALDYLTQTRWSASLCMQIARHYETDGTSQHIFHAVEFYKKASDQEEAQASFRLAQWYETGKEALEQDSKASCAFYLLAMKQKHSQAKTQLEAMAVAGDVQAQYVFGYYVCHQKGDVAQAARWCVKADIQGQPQAATYLAQTPFRVQVCLKIARQYEAHKTDRAKNHRKALTFYHRAAQQNDQNALFALAQWHELDHPGVKRNPRQAFDHYLKAAQQGHPDAWAPLERLGEQMNSQRKRKLGELYGECGEDERQAYWLNQVGDVQRLRLLKR